MRERGRRRKRLRERERGREIYGKRERCVIYMYMHIERDIERESASEEGWTYR